MLIVKQQDKKSRTDTNFNDDSISNSLSNSSSRTHDETHLQIELKGTKNLIRGQENSKGITNLTNVITELLLQTEIQNEEIMELKKRINEYCEEITVLRDQYQKQCKVNDELVERFFKYRKNFKQAMAVDLIYGSRHRKYVLEITLIALAIKYSIAPLKTIINIDNHITCSGSYFRFQSWLNELSENEEPLPEGLLFIAFDNEQKGQRNYLNREINMVIFHIVTSSVVNWIRAFCCFNMDPQNRIQYTNSPWALSSLSRHQYEYLFEITPAMQEAINYELNNYLTEILELLREEK
ncbi:hypothetical protein F8M41_009704 [Gigaspora margarita]|uniref:Uncharacterized protein n=1 Tax=Gigaspora margarita TaxID=4874 RepID=A0A8H4EQP3_GIGMA|nr:hypothetical protein F8M41_009704 [Gigaspora margarita]